MGETIHVTRVGRTPTTAIELVYSPDDDGYYLSNTDFKRSKNRVSKRIYPSREEVFADWNSGTIVWEDWY